MRGVAKDGERRMRGGVIWAELGADELVRFLAECERQRRTSGFLGGRIIADWLKEHASPNTAEEKTKEVRT
jgi:hypothetical protein